MKSIIVLLLALLTLSAAHLPAQPTARIVGGSELEEGEFSFAVWVKFSFSKTHHCTGSVIAPQWVLTAAHCVVSSGGTSLPGNYIQVGVGREFQSAKIIYVDEVIVHPDYENPRVYPDGALLKLNESVTVEPVGVLDLEGESLHASPGTQAVLIGGGLIEGGEAASVLRKASFTIRSDCPFRRISENVMCINTVTGKEPQEGDSGGPLVVRLPNGKWGQVGITKAGAAAGLAPLTRVASIHDWIYGYISGSSPPPPITEIPDDPSEEVYPVTNGASFDSKRVAPDSIATLFGSDLAQSQQIAESLPLPLVLGGVQVQIASGNQLHSAGLFYVSPKQINFLIPKQVSPGGARLYVLGDEGIQGFPLHIKAVGPALFSANGTGEGVGAILWYRSSTLGRDSGLVNAYRYHPIAKKHVAVPISLGTKDESVGLVLFGTGIRGAGGAESVRLNIGGHNVPVLFSGAAPIFVGLDQVNSGSLPRSLIGAGEVGIQLNAAGHLSNIVTIWIE